MGAVPDPLLLICGVAVMRKARLVNTLKASPPHDGRVFFQFPGLGQWLQMRPGRSESTRRCCRHERAGPVCSAFVEYRNHQILPFSQRRSVPLSAQIERVVPTDCFRGTTVNRERCTAGRASCAAFGQYRRFPDRLRHGAIGAFDEANNCLKDTKILESSQSSQFGLAPLTARGKICLVCDLV